MGCVVSGIESLTKISTTIKNTSFKIKLQKSICRGLLLKNKHHILNVYKFWILNSFKSRILKDQILHLYSMEQNLKFSGHETFQCKQFWLKKGFDFVTGGKNFNSPNAVSELGVGKNMVAAINFWTKSFGVIDEEFNTTELGKFIFGETSRDEYLEDIGTVWLLHYSLVTNARASIYNLVFNEFSRERLEFTKEQVHNFLKRKCFEKSDTLYNPATIDKDINTFLKNYLRPQRSIGKSEIEEDYSALLIELELFSSKRIEKNDFYSFEIRQRKNIPIEIILFSILDRFDNNAISFNDLMLLDNSPGKVFCLNRDGMYDKIEEIIEKYKDISFTQTAGNEVLQVNANINKWEMLDGYYK
jgi:Protein of unknown function (DUF4007)